MAISETKKLWKKHFEKHIKPFSRAHLVKELGVEFIYELSLGGKEGRAAFKKGCGDLLAIQDKWKTALDYNRAEYWKEAQTNVKTEILSSNQLGPALISKGSYTGHFSGVYVRYNSDLSTADELVLQIYVKGKPPPKFVEKMLNVYRDKVWNAWVDILVNEFNFTAGTDVPYSSDKVERFSKSKGDIQTGYVSTLLRKQVTGDHRETSTRAISALKDLKKAAPKFSTALDFTEHDIIADIEKQLNIDYNEKAIGKVNKGFGWESYIEVRVGSRKPEKTDKGEIYKIAEKIITKRIEDQIKVKGLPAGFTNKKQSAQSKAEQITGAIVHDIYSKVKKSKAKVSGAKGSKFKSKPIKTTLYKGSNVTHIKRGKKRISIPVKALSEGREQGTKETTTNTAAALKKLQRIINKRLPAEVRRNMGRPALMNRTGRFSNSVRLLSLTEGHSTLVAKYTYLLSPYSTFENTGKKRWPMAYNPKPLIAKSIRNLAMGRIDSKLTLRRV